MRLCIAYHFFAVDELDKEYQTSSKTIKQSSTVAPIQTRPLKRYSSESCTQTELTEAVGQSGANTSVIPSMLSSQASSDGIYEPVQTSTL